MSSTTGTAVLSKFNYSYERCFKLLWNEILLYCLIIAIMFLHWGDIRFDNLLQLLIQFLGLLLESFKRSLILDIGTILEVVAFGSGPFVSLVSMKVPSFWTARSIRWPAEWSLAFFFLNSSSMFIITVSPTLSPYVLSRTFHIWIIKGLLCLSPYQRLHLWFGICSPPKQYTLCPWVVLRPGDGRWCPQKAPCCPR